MFEDFEVARFCQYNGPLNFWLATLGPEKSSWKSAFATKWKMTMHDLPRFGPPLKRLLLTKRCLPAAFPVPWVCRRYLRKRVARDADCFPSWFLYYNHDRQRQPAWHYTFIGRFPLARPIQLCGKGHWAYIVFWPSVVSQLLIFNQRVAIIKGGDMGRCLGGHSGLRHFGV